MKSIINKLAIIFPIILFIPTLAILVSWNALPGDSLYPIKRCLERIALFLVSPSDRVKTDLESNLVERRTNEATKAVVQTGKSSVALKELTYQVEAAAVAVQATNDPKTKQQASLKLISKLEAAKADLIATKQHARTVPSPDQNLPSPTPHPTPSPTSSPLPTSEPSPALEPTPTPIPNDNVDIPTDDIDETNKVIDSTIEKLRQQTESSEDQQNTEPTSDTSPHQRQNDKQEERPKHNGQKKNRD